MGKVWHIWQTSLPTKTQQSETHTRKFPSQLNGGRPQFRPVVFVHGRAIKSNRASHSTLMLYEWAFSTVSYYKSMESVTSERGSAGCVLFPRYRQSEFHPAIQLSRPQGSV